MFMLIFSLKEEEKSPNGNLMIAKSDGIPCRSTIPVIGFVRVIIFCELLPVNKLAIETFC